MEGSEESTVIPAGERLPKTWQPFAEALHIRLPDGKAVTFGDTLYWAPPNMPDIRKLKVLRPGLELGTVKKDRFEPAHALALWLKACETQQDFPGGRSGDKRLSPGGRGAVRAKGLVPCLGGGILHRLGQGRRPGAEKSLSEGLRR